MERMLRATFAALGILGLAAICLLVALRYPDNHGGGLGSFYSYFLCLLVIQILVWAIVRKRMILGIVLSILGLATVWIADYRNILVPYEEWIERGMPDWGVPSPKK